MQLNPITLQKALNDAYRKESVLRTDMDRFAANLTRLIQNLNEAESEEHHKNNLSTFLNDTWYKNQHAINTKGRTDLVIHVDAGEKSPAGVMLEVKRPSNQAEMITADRPNAKALHEIILYYLRERIDHKNVEIKHLIVTNIRHWFIFDAMQFDRLFYQNKGLIKQYHQWNDGALVDKTTDFFFKDILTPFIDQLDAPLDTVQLNLSTYENRITDADQKSQQSLIYLYKILSPPHLLKKSFANDSNTLDKRFYNELLHCHRH